MAMELGIDARTILIISLVLICLLLLLSTITLWFFARKRLQLLMRRTNPTVSPTNPGSNESRQSIQDGEGEEGAVGGSTPRVATRPIEGPPPSYEEVCVEISIRDKR